MSSVPTDVSSSETVQTISQSRIQYLDLLRGLAVLGLLFLNITHMGMFELGYVMHEPVLLADQIMRGVNAFLFDGRFRSLFCILFAVGLYIQWQNYQNKNLQPKPILKSRLFWLVLFGTIHCVFIWPGDILLVYALSGLFLLNRLEWSAEKTLKVGKTFFAIGMLVLATQWALAGYFGEPMVRGSEAFNEAISTSHAPYWEWVMVSLFIAVAYVVTFPILSLFYIVGTMLIGLGLYKSGALKTGFTRPALIKLLLVTLVVSAIDAFIAIVHPDVWQSASGVLASLSGLSMALIIWHFVVKADLASSGSWFVRAVKKVGTMAFTFYILQSLVMTLIFRVYFTELAVQLNLFEYFVVALGFAVIQLVLASLYKLKFNQGPLEYIWRKQVQRTVSKIKGEQQSLNIEKAEAQSPTEQQTVV